MSSLKLIIKINSSALSDGGVLNLRYIQILCQTVAELAEGGYKIVMVSPIPSTNGTLSNKAAEAVNKVELLGAFSAMFAEYNQTIAASDTTEVNELLANKIIPIVFANTAVDAAHIAIASAADKLVVLTNYNGVYNGDPSANPNVSLLEELHAAPPHLLEISPLVNEITAAGIALHAQIETVIINGNQPENIIKAAIGKTIGTKFSPNKPAHEH